MRSAGRFKAKVERSGGKERVSFGVIARTIPHADGKGQDVIIQAPSLQAISDFKKAKGFE